MVPARLGNKEWITVSVDLKEVSGVHELWLTFSGNDDERSMNKYEKELLQKLVNRKNVKLRNDLKYMMG